MHPYQQGLIGNPQDPKPKSIVLTAIDNCDITEALDDIHLDE